MVEILEQRKTLFILFYIKHKQTTSAIIPIISFLKSLVIV